VRPKLAISLNASNEEQRDALMPINKKYPLSALMKACKEYPLRTWEHLTFEYVMLGGLNDAEEDARRVVRLLAPLKSVKVNLIPWNPGELPYRESSAERMRSSWDPGGARGAGVCEVLARTGCDGAHSTRHVRALTYDYDRGAGYCI